MSGPTEKRPDLDGELSSSEPEKYPASSATNYSYNGRYRASTVHQLLQTSVQQQQHENQHQRHHYQLPLHHEPHHEQHHYVHPLPPNRSGAFQSNTARPQSQSSAPFQLRRPHLPRPVVSSERTQFMPTPAPPARRHHYQQHDNPPKAGDVVPQAPPAPHGTASASIVSVSGPLPSVEFPQTQHRREPGQGPLSPARLPPSLPPSSSQTHFQQQPLREDTGAPRKTAGGQILRLPTELKMLAFKYLSKADLKSVCMAHREFAGVVDMIRWANLILDMGSAYKGRATDNTYLSRHLDETGTGLHAPNRSFIHVGRHTNKTMGVSQEGGKNRAVSSVNDFIRHSVHSPNVQLKGRYDDLFSLVKSLSVLVPMYDRDMRGDPSYKPTRKVTMGPAPKNVYWFLTSRVPERFHNLTHLALEMVANSKFDQEDHTDAVQGMLDSFADWIRSGRLHVDVRFDIQRKNRLQLVHPMNLEGVKGLRIFYKTQLAAEGRKTTSAQVQKTIQDACGKTGKVTESVENFGLWVCGGSSSAQAVSNDLDVFQLTFVQELLADCAKLKHLELVGCRYRYEDKDAEKEWLPRSIESLVTDDVAVIRRPLPNVTQLTVFNNSTIDETVIPSRFTNLKKLVLYEYHRTGLPDGLESLTVNRCQMYHSQILGEAKAKRIKHVYLLESCYARRPRNEQSTHRLADNNANNNGRGNTNTRGANSNKQKEHLFDELQINFNFEDIYGAMGLEQYRRMTKAFRVGLTSMGHKQLSKLHNVRLVHLGPVPLSCALVDWDYDAPARRKANNVIKNISDFELYDFAPGPQMALPQGVPEQPGDAFW